jgi:hypothetical protein
MRCWLATFASPKVRAEIAMPRQAQLIGRLLGFGQKGSRFANGLGNYTKPVRQTVP